MANLIGTDVSIQECRASGYVVLDRTGLIKNGKLDKDKPVHITVSNPEMWPDGHNQPGVPACDLYIYDTWMSWNDLWESFESQGWGIKQFCDWENCPIETENPTEWDMVNLASTVTSYCGLK